MLSFCVRRKAGERVGLLSLSELRRYAWEYRRQSTPGARREIIRIVWRHEKAEGLRLLAGMLGVTYDSLYSEGDIREFKRQRNMARRQRSARKTGNINAKDVSRLAAAEAGGGTIANCGGKRTKWKNSSGRIKSAAVGQAWNAKLGGLG
ncbi:hypothetical protein [Desulfofundulus salinus]|uniref:Uncharacterized protein n=1 Tax=Desulfofundulus salinus TaxID=2419843 RepID=A0A494WSS1_9FIRM|nr:hypothetical protein [Desulfofundulus salinum]RKO66358.1 hypothetical protein D7024_04975 [Desulfofundulus salinum]